MLTCEYVQRKSDGATDSLKAELTPKWSLLGKKTKKGEGIEKQDCSK